jgi:hypothetical protein
MAKNLLKLTNIINSMKTKEYLVILEDILNYPYFGEELDDAYSFEYRNLLCFVTRDVTGVWCGYVNFTNIISMLHLIDFPEFTIEEVDKFLTPYKGITYESQNIIGFTCSCDFDDIVNNPNSYKDYYFVIDETKKLADQLITLSRNNSYKE